MTFHVPSFALGILATVGVEMLLAVGIWWFCLRHEHPIELQPRCKGLAHAGHGVAVRFNHDLLKPQVEETDTTTV